MKLKDIKAVNFNKSGSGSISGRIIFKKIYTIFKTYGKYVY